MQLDHVRIIPSAEFYEASCPKHGCDMLIIEHGSILHPKTCFYCPKCDYPYELVMRKMEKFNREGLDKAVHEVQEEAWMKKEWRESKQRQRS